MDLNRFALGSYEIENLDETDLFNLINYADLNGLRYFDTSICYNNDYILGKFIPPSWKVISKIPPQMTSKYDEYLDAHLYYLNRSKIDIGLIHNPRSDWHELAIKMRDDDRIIEYGVSNFGIKDLEEYYQLMRHYPDYNEIEINPGYIDIELINFCKYNNIKIIAYAIYGGKYNAVRTISDFTVPVIVNQVLDLADIVIIRPDSKSQLIPVVNCERVHGLSAQYDESHKSIEPMTYKLPAVSNCMRLGYSFMIPTYSKYNGIPRSNNSIRLLNESPSTVMNDLNNEISNSYFEFITDYRVALRYLLHKLYGNNGCTFKYIGDVLAVQSDNHKIIYYNVYLVDDNNTLTKINKNAVIKCAVFTEVVHQANKFPYKL